MSLGDTALLRSHLAELERTRLLEPLSEEPADVRAWLDFELASLVEGNLGVVMDASQLSAAGRAEWERKATDRRAGLISPHDAFKIPFWISSAGKRVGTIAFGKTFMAGSLVSVHSLYVAQPRRRTGLAARLLDASFQTVRAGGCTGLRVGTSWTWPHAVRFYARRGLWLRSWKHELVFVRQCGLPDYRVEISNGAARFLVGLASRASRIETWT